MASYTRCRLVGLEQKEEGPSVETDCLSSTQSLILQQTSPSPSHSGFREAREDTPNAQAFPFLLTSCLMLSHWPKPRLSMVKCYPMARIQGGELLQLFGKQITTDRLKIFFICKVPQIDVPCNIFQLLEKVLHQNKEVN